MKKPTLRIPACIRSIHDAHVQARYREMKIIEVKTVYQRAQRGEKAFTQALGENERSTLSTSTDMHSSNEPSSCDPKDSNTFSSDQE